MKLKTKSSVNFHKWEKFFLDSSTKISLGGYREVEIPDPIPNSEVKHFIADGTVHKSTGE